MSIALPSVPNRFSIITIGSSEGIPPAWSSRFRWPSEGDEHIALEPATRRGIWAAQLDAAVMRADRAVVLVAEGVGCHAASWWARLSPQGYVSRVAGALLFDPQSQTDDGNSFASPAIALPFPSLVLAPGGAAPGETVESWGSRLIDGHRQREGEQRPWRSAQRLVERFTAKVIERDVERVLALNPLARR